MFSSQGATRHSAFRVGRSERRSSRRPAFREHWRTCIGRHHSEPSRPDGGPTRKRIEIWVASTTGLLDAKSCLFLLTAKDLASLREIQHPPSRNSAIAGRVLLRLALSRAVDHLILPSEWNFSIGSHQRPIIEQRQPQVNFSVSHVDQVVVVAVSADIGVGIDIESVDQDVAEDVVAGFCHIDELAYVRELPEARRVREFIRLWTVKEAYTKMTGQGHFLDFSTLNVLRPRTATAAGATDGLMPFRFESFYITAERELFHVSLAARADHLDERAEVQLVSLVGSGGIDAAGMAPASCANLLEVR